MEDEAFMVVNRAPKREISQKFLDTWSRWKWPIAVVCVIAWVIDFNLFLSIPGGTFHFLLGWLLAIGSVPTFQTLLYATMFG